MLGVLSGLVFIIAGLSAIFHLEFRFSLALVLVFAGVTVVLVALFGFRIRTWDLVLFVVGLVILANVIGLNYYQNNRYMISSYSVSSQYVQVPTIDILATSGLGSINIGFSTNADIAYQVVFQNSFFGFPFLNSISNSSLTNQTRNDVFYLNASSQGSITITIGTSYRVDINATTGVGSINIISPPSTKGSNIQSVSLETGTGSVDAQINAANISGISLKTGTGSINFVSDYLTASTRSIPIAINSGTGSVSVNMKIANVTATQIDASSSLGSITQHLTGFTISTSSRNHLVASIGDIESAPSSLHVTVSVGTGSINISAQPIPR